MSSEPRLKIYQIPSNEYKSNREYRHVSITDTVALDNRARMAARLIEKWGMVVATLDGEDSSGRSKLRLSTPEEVIERAFKCVELFEAEVAKRGWSMELPDPETFANLHYVDQKD